MKLTAFTVNHIDTSLGITPFEYKKFWTYLQDENITVVYRFDHVAESGKHLHYHGVLMGSINYKAIHERWDHIFSVELRTLQTQTDYDKWFNYCKHEMNTIKEQIKEVKDKQLYNRVMTYSKPKQTKLRVTKNLLSVVLIGGF